MSIKIEKKATADNKPYISIEKEGDYKCQLFPINYAGNAESGSKLAYNANLYLIKAGVSVSFDVREITKGEHAGEFLAGDKSRLAGHRAVVTDFLKEQKKVIERAVIPYTVYKELMDNLKVAVATA